MDQISQEKVRKVRKSDPLLAVDTLIHINVNVAPVAQRERRISFALREKVQKEIEQLEQLIFEDVSGKRTPWLSQLVVVPKGEKGIRLCIDMRNANTAITRTRYPTLTGGRACNMLCVIF